MSPHVRHFMYSLPPEGAEACGSEPACAGSDRPKRGDVSSPRALQGFASFGRPGGAQA